MVDPTPFPLPEPALTLRGVSAGYAQGAVLEAVDLRVPQGQLVALVGPNGAGKSTLVKAVLGLLPHRGEIAILGQPRATALPRVAYVPQRAAVDWDFPARVRDVVAMGLFRETGLFGRLTPALRTRIDAAIARVGLTDLAGRQIGALSGGQQQRTFIARALVQDPALFILDEPFAGVDAATEATILALLRNLVGDGRSVIAIHHDIETVRAHFDRAVLLNGRVIAEGPVASVLDSATVARAYAPRLAVPA
jgi:manganese/zinc/iron transport system ATP- binding protein